MDGVLQGNVPIDCKSHNNMNVFQLDWAQYSALDLHDMRKMHDLKNKDIDFIEDTYVFI